MGYQQNPNYSNQQQNYQSQPQPNYDYSSNNEASTYDSEEQEILKLQLDVKGMLAEYEHVALRGEYEHIDEATSKKIWVKFSPNAKAIINNIGIREIIGRMMGYCNQATKLSYFTDEEIYKDMFYFDMSLSELIAKRSTEWELDIETAKSIKDSALELVKSILFSARNGFTAINLKTQYSKQDVSRTDSSGNKQQRSFLGIPLGSK